MVRTLVVKIGRLKMTCSIDLDQMILNKLTFDARIVSFRCCLGYTALITFFLSKHTVNFKFSLLLR